MRKKYILPGLLMAYNCFQKIAFSLFPFEKTDIYLKYEEVCSSEFTSM